MKDFNRKILTYNFLMNEKLIQIFEENKERISEKAKMLLSQLITAQNIWNKSIFKSELLYGVWEQILLKKINSENQSDSGHIIENFNLEKVAAYKSNSGESYKRPIKEIVFHYCNHATYHRFQTVTALKNSGSSPMVSDFTLYKNHY